jgi:hypothetical protein
MNALPMNCAIDYFLRDTLAFLKMRVSRQLPSYFIIDNLIRPRLQEYVKMISKQNFLRDRQTIDFPSACDF